MVAQGLWLGGNLLARLPESLGRLTALRTLGLSGNRLAELPASTNSLMVHNCCAQSVLAAVR